MAITGSLSLHVGQPKTATTSLQAVLFDMRSELEGVGVHYRPGLWHSHNVEAFDLLQQDGETFERMSAVYRHKVKVFLAERASLWDQFVESARRTLDGRS